MHPATFIPHIRKTFGPHAEAMGFKEAETELGHHHESVLFLSEDRFLSILCLFRDGSLTVTHGPADLVTFDNDEYIIEVEQAERRPITLDELFQKPEEILGKRPES